MKREEVISKLEEAGLTVQLTPLQHISVCAGSIDPPEEFRSQGVTAAWEYGCSIYQTGDEWAFRQSAPKPAEFHGGLEEVYERIMETYESYLEEKKTREGTEKQR